MPSSLLLAGPATWQPAGQGRGCSRAAAARPGRLPQGADGRALPSACRRRAHRLVLARAASTPQENAGAATPGKEEDPVGYWTARLARANIPLATELAAGLDVGLDIHSYAPRIFLSLGQRGAGAPVRRVVRAASALTEWQWRNPSARAGLLHPGVQGAPAGGGGPPALLPAAGVRQAVKRIHTGEVVLVQVGGYYEAFGVDAVALVESLGGGAAPGAFGPWCRGEVAAGHGVVLVHQLPPESPAPEALPEGLRGLEEPCSAPWSTPTYEVGPVITAGDLSELARVEGEGGELQEEVDAMREVREAAGLAPGELEARLEELRAVLPAGGGDLREMILGLPPGEAAGLLGGLKGVARNLVSLKLALPHADVVAMVARRPSLVTANFHAAMDATAAAGGGLSRLGEAGMREAAAVAEQWPALLCYGRVGGEAVAGRVARTLAEGGMYENFILNNPEI